MKRGAGVVLKYVVDGSTEPLAAGQTLKVGVLVIAERDRSRRG
jgi:hypothetical protein